MNADQIWRAIESRVLRAIHGYKPSSLALPAPVNYTPAWTADTTNPAIGNGTLAGVYTLTGKMVDAWIYLLIGSTTTLGTGNWHFSLPFTVASLGVPFYGVARIRNAATANHARLAQLSQGSTDVYYFVGMDDNTNLNNIGPTAPFAWGQGDSMAVSIRYLKE